MISYELAKQLRDKGFPQDKVREGYCIDCKKWKDINCFDNKHKTDFIKIPTLSELIKACGDRFHCLVHTTTGGFDSSKEFWSAGVNNVVSEWSNGSTPDEAVAKLFIQLRKHDSL